MFSQSTENSKSYGFQGVEKGCIENDWVKETAYFLFWEIYNINTFGLINTVDSGEIYFWIFIERLSVSSLTTSKLYTQFKEALFELVYILKVSTIEIC